MRFGTCFVVNTTGETLGQIVVVCIQIADNLQLQVQKLETESALALFTRFTDSRHGGVRNSTNGKQHRNVMPTAYSANYQNHPRLATRASGTQSGSHVTKCDSAWKLHFTHSFIRDVTQVVPVDWLPCLCPSQRAPASWSFENVCAYTAPSSTSAVILQTW